MAKFNWYLLFNKQEFDDLDLPSKDFDVDLGEDGIKTVLVTKGNYTSIVVDDVILPINLNDRNPFRFGERAVHLDGNGDVWLGVFSAD